MHINLPLIIGLASGFALVNSLLVLTWCLCRRRKSKADHEQARLTDMKKQPSLLKKNRLRLKLDLNSIQSEKYDRYPVSHSPMRRIYPLPPLSSGLPPPLRNQLAPPREMGVTRAPSARSDDSASIYSTVSAPVHLHEELLLSHPVPDTISTYKVDRPGYSSMEPRLSVIRELAPEPYDRKRHPQWSGYPSRTPLKFDYLQVPRSTFSPTPKQPIISNPMHLRSGMDAPAPVVKQTQSGWASSHLPSPYSPPLRQREQL